MTMNPRAVDPGPDAPVMHPQVGARVQQRRKELGLRPEVVAGAAGISLATLARVERGYDTTLGTLKAIAAALETTVGQLTDENGEAA